MYSVAVLTISDSGSAGKREDLSGPTIVEIMEKAGYNVVDTRIIPDDRHRIEAIFREIADEHRANLILTTGGTGFAPRDVTPEATVNVSEKLVPGIPEAMRALSMEITPRAMLTRAQAGIRGETLIINLPGSPKAVTECLEYILDSLKHGLDILCQRDSECAR